MICENSALDKTLKNESSLENSKIQLHEEKLDVVKKWVQTGEVIVHKEVLTEERNIVVAVMREELVIEKKVFNKEALDKSNEQVELIRIPISEEHIEIIKHLKVHENVSVYNQQLQKIEHIEDTIKKERLHMEVKGDINIKDIET